eukprot:TRINITY_DN6701_c0_g1_i1.p1 TRINITY_DN6701_c0_g1~~TRINITY_DN6701_c0_g1_i1.p1  ORF type:complete len:106 (+),score=15.54 TRINITY_DN6701_c0_g1_i1:32-319(+)
MVAVGCEANCFFQAAAATALNVNTETHAADTAAAADSHPEATDLVSHGMLFACVLAVAAFAVVLLWRSFRSGREPDGSGERLVADQGVPNYSTAV